MLSILLMTVTTIGGFSYEISTVCDREKPVASAPRGYEPTWKETVETIEAAQPEDADFTRFMQEHAFRLQQQYYGFVGDKPGSFETHGQAGSVEVTQDVTAASPDLVSVTIGISFYEAGMAHPNSEGVSRLIWSRRLHRQLTQDDVFAVPPDRALRRLALAQFDNRDDLQNPDDPEGIPLWWDHASIGPDGITWSFEPYELGGYLSAGSAMLRWSELESYLSPELPFAIDEIRRARSTARQQKLEACPYAT